MDMTALRALVRATNFATHGVPATVTRPEPNDTPILTRIIWLTPFTEDAFGGMSVQRREARQQVAIRRDAVPTVPRGTIVEAAGPLGGSVGRWRVEGPDRLEADHGRYIVVSDPEPYSTDPEL
jgi:hypothetical protein